VLDDTSPLRQATTAMNDADAVLYKPEPAAIPAGSARSYGGNNPSSEAAQLDPLLVISADAPPSGAVIHYYLKADNGPVSLDILNSAGQVVRHYTSTERPFRQNPRSMTVAAVFSQPPAVLSAAAGSHEWSWDLREVKPGAAIGGRGRGGFGRGGAGGSAAAPGNYTVRLTAGGHEYTQPLTVTLAPGATYTPVSAAQQQLASQIQALDAQVARARGEAASLRTKLTGLAPQASGSVAAAISKLADEARDIEGFAAEPPNPDASGEGDATPAPSSLIGLTGILGQLSGAAQSQPIATVQAGFAKAKVMAEAQLAKWNQLRTTDVAALNRQLQQANLPPVTVGSNR
jgi:hypothetical protein